MSQCEFVFVCEAQYCIANSYTVHLLYREVFSESECITIDVIQHTARGTLEFSQVA